MLSINGYLNLKKPLGFLFGPNANFTVLSSIDDKQLFDLTPYKENCISFKDFESKYSNWISLSNRENTMDECGSLLGIIGYIQRNKEKKNLVLISKKRKYSV